MRALEVPCHGDQRRTEMRRVGTLSFLFSCSKKNSTPETSTMCSASLFSLSSSSSSRALTRSSKRKLVKSNFFRSLAREQLNDGVARARALFSCHAGNGTETVFAHQRHLGQIHRLDARNYPGIHFSVHLTVEEFQRQSNTRNTVVRETHFLRL